MDETTEDSQQCHDCGGIYPAPVELHHDENECRTARALRDGGIDLDALEAKYTAEAIPPCRLCGAELKIASMGGGNPTKWVCSAVDTSTRGWINHWRQSEFLQTRHGDSQVVALVQEVRVRGMVVDEGQEILADVIAERRVLRDTVNRVETVLAKWVEMGRADGIHGTQIREALEGGPSGGG